MSEETTKKKKAGPKMISPKGVASYPWLSKADTKYNPDGEFRVTLLIPVDEAQPFMDKLDTLAEEAFKEAVDKAKPAEKKKISKAEPYEMECDDEGEETGRVKFKFKLKAHVKIKKGEEFDQRPKIFDAKGQLLPEGTAVYGGSILKVSFQPVPYTMASTKEAGVSLRMLAVQVIKLVSGGGSNDAGDYGFGEEDGYEADTFEGTTTTQEEGDDF